MGMESAKKVETETGQVKERHYFANGWGASVIADTSRGLLDMTGETQLLVPTLKGWELVWDTPDRGEIPDGLQFDMLGLRRWVGVDQLASIMEHVAALPQYTHECDHSECNY